MRFCCCFTLINIINKYNSEAILADGPCLISSEEVYSLQAAVLTNLSFQDCI